MSYELDALVWFHQNHPEALKEALETVAEMIIEAEKLNKNRESDRKTMGPEDFNKKYPLDKLFYIPPEMRWNPCILVTQDDIDASKESEGGGV